MSRMQYFTRNPKRSLASLTAVLAAVGVAVGSGANFSASSANPSNTFTAGDLKMSNSKANAAILTASNMKPGGTATTGTVDIANTGSLGGTFTLSDSSLSDSGNTAPTTYPYSGKVNLTVVDCGLVTVATPNPDCSTGTTIYTGTLQQFGTTGHVPSSLGTFAAGDKHRYQFSVALDSSADNNYQDGSSSVEFDWSAAQN